MILTDEKYVGLSEDAMLLYGILLDRRSLSERKEMIGEIRKGMFLFIVLLKRFR